MMNELGFIKKHIYMSREANKFIGCDGFGDRVRKKTADPECAMWLTHHHMNDCLHGREHRSELEAMSNFWSQC